MTRGTPPRPARAIRLGCRLPPTPDQLRGRLSPDHALSIHQDRLPQFGFTILRLGNTKIDTKPLQDAIAGYGAPVATLDIPDQIARDIYQHDVILLRPDVHVVWRGNEAPDAADVARIATGH